jgi:hypothetical protein
MNRIFDVTQGPPGRNGKPANNTRRRFDRLAAAMRIDRLELMPFRQNRVNAIRNYVGQHYSQSGSVLPRPLNMLKLACGIYLRHLVSTSPRVSWSTPNPQLKLAATGMEHWMNTRLAKMRIEDKLRICALDAIFSIGIAKVGLCCTGHSVEIAGQFHDYGMPFFDAIDLDDWVHDMRTKRWDQVAYMGHRYRIPVAAVHANESYDEQLRMSIVGNNLSLVNEVGDQRVDALSRSYQPFAGEPENYTELWDLYLPRTQEIATFPSSGVGLMGATPLSVKPWVGPEYGPFPILSYGVVPGNTMPSAPVHDMLDVDNLINDLTNKLFSQARRQKNWTAVPGYADKDGKRLIDIKDGEAWRMEQPGAIQEMHTGGIDPANFQFVTSMRQLFTYLAGNLDSLGGLSPQAQTLGQEQMLTANSSRLVQSMQDDTVAFSHRALESLAWYYWTDPLQTYKAQVQIPKTDIKVTIPITPEMRALNFEELDLRLDQYSLQNETPAQRGNKLMQYVMQVLMPAAPIMAQQGIGINWHALNAKMAQLQNMPDLVDILTDSEQLAQQAQQQAQGQGQDQGGANRDMAMKPVSTSRTVRHQPQPPQGQQGNDNQMMQSLMAQVADGRGQAA